MGDAPARRRPGARAAAAALALAVVLALGTGPAGHPTAAAPVPARQAEDDAPQLPVAPGGDAERSRRTAEEILERPEYQAPEQRDRSISDRIRDWLGDRAPDLTPGEGTTNLLSYLAVGLVVLGSLGALTWVLASSRRSRRAPLDEDADVDVTVSPLRSPTEWAEEAERCEREGDHRGAVRARFRVLTTTLARRELVADTPGRTAGELRGDVAERAPTLVPAFGAAADHFERAWFGKAPVGPDAATAARTLTDRALDAAPRRPVAADAEADLDPVAPAGTAS